MLPYLTDLTTAEQQQRWLPGVVTGETVIGIAMTEPGAGSDLAGIRTTAVRDGDHYVVNGAKTFISNGQTGDLFVVAVRTAPDRHKGLSLLVVEPDTPGFSAAATWRRSACTPRTPASSASPICGFRSRICSEEEGRGFYQLMDEPAAGTARAGRGCGGRRRGHASPRRWTTSGSASVRLADLRLPAHQFVLAELATEIDIARTYLDDCIAEHLVGELTAARAARLKWWTTDLQVRTADRCLQLHGGYGYMREYRVSRAFVDARIQTIYGGTNEIMKTIIAKDFGI